MDPNQANSSENQRQAIDAEIKTLAESIRVLSQRRNALAPVSSLPPEVFAAIFSFLRVPVASSLTWRKKPNHLAWLCVAHVCHQWREIALNQPLFWSHVNFTAFSSAGVAEILTRAKTAPLYIEARVPSRLWDDARFRASQNELQARASRICHLSMSAETEHLRQTLEGLVSPAPTLEYLSLSTESGSEYSKVSIPDTLFDGTTPRLSFLELGNCVISWNSPLLKGLTFLDIRGPHTGEMPSLSVWLDALDKMPQLKTLTLHSASPIALSGPSRSSDVERTITLPFLTHLDISNSARNCGLALAHLVLPALTRLCLKVTSDRKDGRDVQKVLPHFSRHAHELHDRQHLQCVVVRSDKTCADMLAWAVPDIDVNLADPVVYFNSISSASVVFSIKNDYWPPGTVTKVFDMAMEALPLDHLVTLTSRNRLCPFDEQVCLRHLPRLPLLRCLRLGPSPANKFQEMLLNDNGGRESPLLPSLTTIILVDTIISVRRTLRLCDTLMKRVEQGVPLEMLNLRNCIATSRTAELLSEIVVDVLGPDERYEESARILSKWDSSARGHFAEDYNSGLEDADDDDDYDEDNLGDD